MPQAFSVARTGPASRGSGLPPTSRDARTRRAASTGRSTASTGLSQSGHSCSWTGYFPAWADGTEHSATADGTACAETTPRGSSAPRRGAGYSHAAGGPGGRSDAGIESAAANVGFALQLVERARSNSIEVRRSGGCRQPADCRRIHVSVSFAFRVPRTRSPRGRPAMAPPNASVIDAGRHLFIARSRETAARRKSAPGGEFEWVILGLPKSAPSRLRLNTIVTSRPSAPAAD